MSKQDDPIVQPYLKADISCEDDPFDTNDVRYRGSGYDYHVGGRISSESELKTLFIFCRSKFDITKTYQLVPRFPQEGEAELLYTHSTSEDNFSVSSDRGELKFVAEPSGLHGFFNAFIDALPGGRPEITITGSFRVHSI